MTQKEFTFPVASSNSTSRVARPTKVIPLGKALESKGGRLNGTTVGTASVISASSQSKSSRDSGNKKKYRMSALQPTTASSNSRQRSHRSSDPIPKSSYHSSFKVHSDNSLNHDNDDSFDGADDVDWWGEANVASEQFTSPTSGRTSTNVRKVKVKSSDHPSSGHSSRHAQERNAKRVEPTKLEQAMNRHRPEQAAPYDDKSVQSRSRRTTKAPSRNLGRSHSLGPSRDSVSVPKGSLLGAPAADDDSYDGQLSPSTSPLRRSRVRWYASSRSKSQDHMPSVRRPGSMSASVSIQSTPSDTAQTGRVKVGRVARPSRSGSEDESGFPAAPSKSLGQRATTTGSMSRKPTGATDAFDPFVASEHNSHLTDLPLQIQRRGKYSDKEAMLRKCKEIGISERMLRDMKHAGLIITEGKV